MSQEPVSPVSRRGFLGGSAAFLAGVALGGREVLGAHGAPQGAPASPAAPADAGPHSLPALPYPYDALEPAIDARTMEIHHGRHHAAYIANLNRALAGHPDLASLSVEDLLATGASKVPETIRQTVIDHGGGHANHSHFWRALAPRGSGGAPSEELARALDGTFGGVEGLQRAMNEAGAKRFGSGWVWLARTADGKLEVFSTANQDSPWLAGKRPILGIDVWEHAYYLHYQNRRADYLKAIWEVVNWSEASRLFGA